jgi:hypothetical protein
MLAAAMNGEELGVPTTGWGRSWFTLRQALRLLREDRALALVAALGTLLTMVAAAGIFGGAAAVLHTGASRDDLGASYTPFGLVLAVGLMYPVSLIATAMNVVLIAMVQARLEGRPMSVGGAARFALRRWRTIAGWTLLDVGIGALLDRIASRLPFGGALVSLLGATAWSLASMFAIPVIVVEGAGPIAATRRSAAVFRARWGEGLSATIQSSGLALVFVMPGLIMVLVGIEKGFDTPGTVAVTLAGAALTALGVVLSRALNEFVVLAIYRAHVLGVPVFGLTSAELDGFVEARSVGRGRFDA